MQDVTKPTAPIVQIVKGKKNSHNVINVDDNYFYIHTDKDASTGKIVIAPITKPNNENWKTLVAAKTEVLSASSGGGYLFCTYLKDAVTKVYQHSMDGKMLHEINLPGLGTANGFYAKITEKELFYTYTSYINPAIIFKYNIASGKSDLYKQSNVLFNASDYESKQVFYPSKDGTKIPMIITYKKSINLNGKNPCLLYSYDGFGVSLTPNFSTSNIILLENGGVFEVPNIRGGGEYERPGKNKVLKPKSKMY